MKNNVYVIGTYGIPVGKHTDKSHRDIVRETYLGVLEDAGIESRFIGSLWSASSMLHSWKQYCIIGQVMTVPLVEEGLLPGRIAVNNVENACASGSSAFQSAVIDVASGYHDVSLAIGFEKLVIPGNPALTFSQIGEGSDRMHPEETMDILRKICIEQGKDPDSMFSQDRSPAMDLYSLQAIHHMQKYGTTQKQFAIIAAKNHCNGSKNPIAQYRFTQTVEEVLADREIVYPLTRAMCSPVGDGACAAIVCNEDFFKNLPVHIKNRAIRVMGMGMSSGRFVGIDEPSLTRYAADEAYANAGVGPGD